MKKNLSIFFALATFLSLTAISHADYTVIPGSPYERQFNLEVEPGSRQSASIVIKNLGNNAETLNIYSADATHSAQGTFAITTKNTEQFHIGNWISFEEDKVIIPPREEITIPFIIEIPENATPGSYAGGIAVEQSSGSRQLNDANGEAGQSGISVSSRFIVKVFLSIPGEKIHSYKWEDFKFEYAGNDSHARFVMTVSNDGNTIVMVDPKVELTGFPPLKEPVIELPSATIQPGTESQKIDLRFTEKPRLGFYFAKGTATFSELDIINNEKVNPETQTREITINLTPWYLIVIITLVLLTIIIAPFVWYFRSKNYYSRCETYEVKEGQTIISIAKENKSNWKKIVKINKLKPPYNLKPGQTILIPPKKSQ